jgi:hypothetical protein
VTGKPLADSPQVESLIDDVVAYYQEAATELRTLTR